jgi:hypothetical protein
MYINKTSFPFFSVARSYPNRILFFAFHNALVFLLLGSNILEFDQCLAMYTFFNFEKASQLRHRLYIYSEYFGKQQVAYYLSLSSNNFLG